MTAWRQAIELAIGEKDLAELGAIARSRTEPASRVERGVFSPWKSGHGKGRKEGLNASSTSPSHGLSTSHRLSIYFNDILPDRFNSWKSGQGKDRKEGLNASSTSPSHRLSIYFPDILPDRFNSFTRSLKVSTLLILEGKRPAREFASSD